MEVLRVYVNVTGCHEVVSDGKGVRMLLFEGTCDGPFFTGTILSGGVDTQKSIGEGKGTLSARYMIQGTDCEGNSCRLFVENNAEFNSDTVPSIITDSPYLKWMETAKLRGKIGTIDGRLTIRIEMTGAREDTVGMSESSVLIFEDMVCKIETCCKESEREYQMLQWLKGKLSVPQVICRGKWENKDYLLMSKLPGSMSCDEEYMRQPEFLAEALAEGLRKL